MAKNPHIAIVPSPGMGHVIPLVEFAKRLVHSHDFSVTFFIPTDAPPSSAAKSVLSSLPSSIHHHFLPPVSFTEEKKDPSILAETLISLTVSRSLPALRHLLKPLAASCHLGALIVDLFATDAFDVASESGIPPYVFFPSTAMALSLFLYLRDLDASVSCQYRDLPEPVRIPGCIPIHGSELLDPVQDRDNDAYRHVLYHGNRFRMAEGVMLNSFNDVEPGAIKALTEKNHGGDEDKKIPPVYPIGPLVKMEDPNGIVGSGASECLRWLDEQPAGSVLFVSFGSGGTLSHEQLTELAHGLETSEQRFLWVARSPSRTSNSSFFSVNSQEDPTLFLPEGFLDRVGGRGLVVPSWAPQAEVLSHGATSGFLSHCGWNSTLESVVRGVPLIAWPLYAEQKMNAAMLTGDLNVALRPRARDDGVIGREEIARVVKGLMEGEEGKRVRNRMKELKDAAAKVLSPDGSSTRALAELAHKWKTPSQRT